MLLHSIDPKRRESPAAGAPIARGAAGYRALAADLLQFVSEWTSHD